jgi:DNA primase
VEPNSDYIIVETIKGFLGSPKTEYDALNKKQWQFNCPTPKCRQDIDKFNLEYNSEKHQFKCWKCNYKGFVHKLAQDYGSGDDITRIKSLLPYEKQNSLRNSEQNKPKINHNLITCKLPEGYLPLSRKRGSNLYKIAWDYLVHERKVSPDIIDKYEIGYTETGPRKLRIIIPSKNTFGQFNYYEARSYVKGKNVISYLKPPGDEVHKNDIIFNEHFINWDIPVFLVEGVFDMFRLPNAIPVLGKEISELLTDKLLKNNCTVILCFDPDAIDKTVETYSKLSSLGLNVFFVDLVEYNEKYVEQNLNHLRGARREKELNRDISEIYEERGKLEVANAVKHIKRLGLSMQINKILKED